MTLWRTHLELTRPYVRGRVVDERPREVALHPADGIVVLCVFSLPDKRKTQTRARRPPWSVQLSARRTSTLGSAEGRGVTTHEMIPNAWYSMIEERDIRERSPCCMPRSKRRIATFGDGCRRRRARAREMERRRGRRRLAPRGRCANFVREHSPLQCRP